MYRPAKAQRRKKKADEKPSVVTRKDKLQIVGILLGIFAILFIWLSFYLRRMSDQSLDQLIDRWRRRLEGCREATLDRHLMTVCAILFGLLPIMWSPTTQAGADVMKRIAAPMIGGIVTSAILELLIYPVIFVIWKRRSLPEPSAIAQPQPALV